MRLLVDLIDGVLQVALAVACILLYAARLGLRQNVRGLRIRHLLGKLKASVGQRFLCRHDAVLLHTTNEQGASERAGGKGGPAQVKHSALRLLAVVVEYAFDSTFYALSISVCLSFRRERNK